MNDGSRHRTPRAAVFMNEVDISRGGRVKFIQTNAERVFGPVSMQLGLGSSMKLPCAAVSADSAGPGWRWSVCSLCP